MKKIQFKTLFLLLAIISAPMVSCGDNGEDELPNTQEEQTPQEEKNDTIDEAKLLNQTTTEISEEEYVRLRIQVYESWNETEENGWHVIRDGLGLVTTIFFDDTTTCRPPRDAASFFTQFFGQEAAAQFKLEHSGNQETSWGESYGQYFEGMKVSDFHFSFDNGIMISASGQYISMDGFIATPAISADLARRIYASYLKVNVEAVSESPQMTIKLIPDGKQFLPRLVYEVDCRPKTGAIACYPGGWVDARTGRMIEAFTINI